MSSRQEGNSRGPSRFASLIERVHRRSIDLPKAAEPPADGRARAERRSAAKAHTELAQNIANAMPQTIERSTAASGVEQDPSVRRSGEALEKASERLEAAIERVVQARKTKTRPPHTRTETGRHTLEGWPEKGALQTLGEGLIARGLISAAQRDVALARQFASGQLFGQILVDIGAIDAEQLAAELKARSSTHPPMQEILARVDVRPHHLRLALDNRSEASTSIIDALREADLLSAEKAAKILAVQHAIEFLPRTELDDVPIESLRRAGIALTEYRGYVPIAVVPTIEPSGNGRRRISIAVSHAAAMAEAATKFAGYTCHFHAASEAACAALYRRYFVDTSLEFDRAAEGPQTAETLFDALLRHARAIGATDIALQRADSDTIALLRAEGRWIRFRTLPPAAGPLLFERIDTLVSAPPRPTPLPDIGMQARPAAGRAPQFLAQHHQWHFLSMREAEPAFSTGFGLRIAAPDSREALPASAWLRLTEPEWCWELDQLGLDATTYHRLRAYLCQRAGVLIVSGPARSGRTTTLHSLLREADPAAELIHTIEHQVEYRHRMWHQIETAADRSEASPRSASALGAALNAALRHAPDKLLVGEVDDAPTAAGVFRAAEGGSVVLSTLHSAGAADSVRCLQEFGVTPSRMASGLLGILSQRLVRKLCAAFKRVDERNETHRLIAPLDTVGARSSGRAVPYRASPSGCLECRHSGHRGQRLISELLHCGPKIRDQLASGAGLGELKKAMSGATLRDSGLRLLAEGCVSLEALAAQIELED